MSDSDLELANQDSVMRFLKESTLKISETLTGILASDKKDLKLSAGKIVQATIKGTLLTQLGREIEVYIKKGKIKEDYFASRKNQASLYELLKFLDESVPDDDLFQALKSIFFSGISVDASLRDEIMAYEFLQTAKRLTGTEIMILKANFNLARNRGDANIHKEILANASSNRSAWRRVVAEEAGFGELDSVVEKYELNLETLGLIGSRSADNRFASDFIPTQNLRLTTTGLRFCEYISRYE